MLRGAWLSADVRPAATETAKQRWTAIVGWSSLQQLQTTTTRSLLQEQSGHAGRTVLAGLSRKNSIRSVMFPFLFIIPVFSFFIFAEALHHYVVGYTGGWESAQPIYITRSMRLSRANASSNESCNPKP